MHYIVILWSAIVRSQIDSSNRLLILVAGVLAKVPDAWFVHSNWPCIHLCRREAGLCKHLYPHHDKHQHRQQGWGVKNTTTDTFRGPWKTSETFPIRYYAALQMSFLHWKALWRTPRFLNLLSRRQTSQVGSELTAYAHMVDQQMCLLDDWRCRVQRRTQWQSQ